jgi:hypothetical protein
LGTSPSNPDSDADGFKDGFDYFLVGGFGSGLSCSLGPLAADTADGDGDGLLNAYECYTGPLAGDLDHDPMPNGVRNRLVDIADTLAVLLYAFAEPSGLCGDNLNVNGVDYDCDKGIDTNGDTVADIPPDGVADGLDYDRTASAAPNPPWDAGASNGVVDIADVLATLAQAFVVDCSGPP